MKIFVFLDKTKISASVQDTQTCNSLKHGAFNELYNITGELIQLSNGAFEVGYSKAEGTI